MILVVVVGDKTLLRSKFLAVCKKNGMLRCCCLCSWVHCCKLSSVAFLASNKVGIRLSVVDFDWRVAFIFWCLPYVNIHTV